MACCDLCGKDLELVRAKIEGTELSVCPRCSRFGEVLPSPVKTRVAAGPTARAVESLDLIVPDYPDLIKHAREQRKMQQHELAKAINEKESVIHKLEAGSMQPSLALARKLERFFKITLITPGSHAPLAKETLKNQHLTIGDLLKIKKR